MARFSNFKAITNFYVKNCKNLKNVGTILVLVNPTQQKNSDF